MFRQIKPSVLRLFIDAQPNEAIDDLEQNKRNDAAIDGGRDRSKGLDTELLANIQVLHTAAKCRGRENPNQHGAHKPANAMNAHDIQCVIVSKLSFEHRDREIGENTRNKSNHHRAYRTNVAGCWSNRG